MSGRIHHFGLLVAVAACILPGCTKGTTPGKEIRFSANASGLRTRTEYSGDGTFSGGVLVEERINWLLGDKFTVLAIMPDATTQKADYIVKSVDSPALYALKSRATVDPVALNGIQWAASGTHTFIARYPENSGGVDNTGISGTIPASLPESGHSLSCTKSGTTTTMAPDMNYAFMFATTSAAAGASEVELDFIPEFTAFEFQVECGDNDRVELTSFTLSSTSQPLAGAFTVAASGRTVTVPSTNPKSIVLDFTTLTGGKLTLNRGEDLVFTVFALPTTPSGTLTNLTISFTSTQFTGIRKLDLNYENGTPYSFTGCHKHCITGIRFPNLLDAGGEYIEWDQEVYGEGFIWD